MARDELEPFTGTYDWDEAFNQNPDQLTYAVSDRMKQKVHGVLIARPRTASTTTGWFMATV